MGEREVQPLEHLKLSRRQLLPGAIATAAALRLPEAVAEPRSLEPLPAELAQAVAGIEPYFFAQARFGDVSRGNPVPHSLPEEKKREAGLTRETWKLEVIADPEQPAALGRQLTKTESTAHDFRMLMQLAEKHAVRFPKIMTCLN